jgi:hypothetical protein
MPFGQQCTLFEFEWIDDGYDGVNSSSSKSTHNASKVAVSSSSTATRAFMGENGKENNDHQNDHHKMIIKMIITK